MSICTLKLIFHNSWNIGKVPNGWKEKLSCDNILKGLMKPESTIRLSAGLQFMVKWNRKREKLINTTLKEHNAINVNCPGFMEDRLCQRKFLIFFDEVTNLTHESNSDNVIYLDFCKAFDLVLHNTLIRKLKQCKINIADTTLNELRAG